MWGCVWVIRPSLWAGLQWLLGTRTQPLPVLDNGASRENIPCAQYTNDQQVTGRWIVNWTGRGLSPWGFICVLWAVSCVLSTEWLYPRVCNAGEQAVSEWWPVNATGCYWAAISGQTLAQLSARSTGSFFVDRPHSTPRSITLITRLNWGKNQL